MAASWHLSDQRPSFAARPGQRAASARCGFPYSQTQRSPAAHLDGLHQAALAGAGLDLLGRSPPRC